MGTTEKFKIRNKIWMDSDMFYSAAFKSLSASALRTLMRCLQKRKWEKQKKRKQPTYLNEPFIFPYAEAAFLGIGSTQFWKNINKLIEVGFLELEYQGGWYQKHEREKDYNRYMLSERWCKYGTPEFKEVKKERTLLQDFQIQKNIERKKLKTTSRKRSVQLHKNEDDRPKMGNCRIHFSETVNREIQKRQSVVLT